MSNYKFIKLEKLKDNKKKYKAIFLNKNTNRTKSVSFGASGYSDYLQHKDPERKQRYINRHKKRENWDNPLTAGFWSRYLLWSEPTYSKALKVTKNKLKTLGYL